MNTNPNGPEEKNRYEIAVGLTRWLEDHQSLLLKTLNFDKSAKGPLVPALHLMFEEHAAEVRDGMKALTDRIQTLAPDTASIALETRHLNLKLGSYEFLEPFEILKELRVGHDTILRAGEDLLMMAVKFKDEATASLLISRMKVHQRTAWWLRQMLEASL